MDVPERSNRTGRSFAPVTTIFYRLDRKSLASLMRGAPEYLPLTDISRRLSKLCKDSSISNKQPLSEIRRIYTPIHASPPLRSCPLLLASGSPLFPTTKNASRQNPLAFSHILFIFLFRWSTRTTTAARSTVTGA